MAGALVTVALIVSALLLTLVVPRTLAHWRPQRYDPARALLLWQSVSISGVVCALLAAPVAALSRGLGHPLLLGLAISVSAVMLARVLWSGHRVGTDLRRLRAEHRALVDLLGERMEGLEGGAVPDPVRILAHPAPTAFCLPGKGDRIVLSRTTIERMGPVELRAVLAHEQAHLDHRHDLLLELFTVLHEAVPAPVRAQAAMLEVRLLVEVLADHRAAARASAPALARALVAMAAPHPLGPRQASREHALSAATTQVGTRLQLLAAPPPTRRLRATLTGGTVAVLGLPVTLVLLLWWV
ncbi:M56 family metallopeptidase [Ornithinimicrobium pratense]|uniref:M56 family metallopeptidase n=1 Tax=Ornithinimicrobium pratense TaxID=2593973 RepID=A0A5J6V3F0_9MICO|nr:M56 family metallopeptidase [Ornithinimicrobium pratense]QFG67483.1 M56 family metallopeptidase [Ornithinimicrobium pratense]